MSAIIKKLIIIMAIVVFILFIALLITAWSIGAFAPVNIGIGEKGPYYFISLDQKSLYPYISEQIDKIKNELTAKNIPYLKPAALIYSDPTVTPLNQVLAQGLRDRLQKYNDMKKSPLSYLEIYDKNRVIVEMSIIQVEKE
jgi:hypothetical protein